MPSTPVIKYWNFKQNPFRDCVLKGKNLTMFICREEDLNDLEDAIDNHLIGICGSLGVGKSSFLNKFKELMEEKTDLPIILIDMATGTEMGLYQEILYALLKNCKNKIINLYKKFKIDINKEIDRIEANISELTSSEFGAQSIAVVKHSEQSAKQIASHTPSSCRSLIQNIISNSKNEYLIIIDNFERIQYFIQDQNKTYLNVLAGFTQTFSDLPNDNVAFIVTLDDHFKDLMEKERKTKKGFFSFSFGEFISLNNFSPMETKIVLETRLKLCKWKKSLLDFIPEDTFWLLMLASDGHPRKSFKILREAMKYVEKKRAELKLSNEAILYGINKSNEIIDEKDISIIKYLKMKGPSSPSNQSFQQALNLSRMSLSDRLKNLKERIYLISQKIDEKSGKIVYSLPDIFNTY